MSDELGLGERFTQEATLVRLERGETLAKECIAAGCDWGDLSRELGREDERELIPGQSPWLLDRARGYSTASAR